MKKSIIILSALLLASCAKAPVQPEAGLTEQTDTSVQTQAEAVTEASAETVQETEPVSSEETTAESDEDNYVRIDESYLKSCRDILLEKLAEEEENENYYYSQFSFYDMNGDDIPELLVSDGDYHLAQVSIYTEGEDGSAALIDTFGSFGVIGYYPETGYFRETYSGMGAVYRGLFTLKGREYEKIISINSEESFDENNDPSDAKFYINDEEVNEEEYTAAEKEYFSGEVILLGREFLVDRGVIDAMFGITTRNDAFDAIINATGIYEEHWQTEGAGYVYSDINGDGLDELIIDSDYYITVYDFYGRPCIMGCLEPYHSKNTDVALYNYDLDMSVLFDGAEDGYMLWYDRENSRMIVRCLKYSDNICVYDYKGGVFREADGYTSYRLSDGSYIYFINGESTDESTYRSALEELFTDSAERLAFEPFGVG